MSMTSLLAITPWPAVSAVILLALLVVALYFARRTAHQAIRAVTDALGRGLRLASHAVARGEEKLAARNRGSVPRLTPSFPDAQTPGNREDRPCPPGSSV